MQDRDQFERDANTLLAVASTDLMEGRPERAYIIAKGLSSVSFFRQGEARILMATAAMHKHPKSVYENAVKEFKAILDDYQDKTLTRAYALMGLAWANIGNQNYQEAKRNVEEAAHIFTDLGATDEIGSVNDVQGLLEINDGQLEGALTKIRRSKIFDAIDLPKVLRASFSGFERSPASATEPSGHKVLVGV